MLKIGTVDRAFPTTKLGHAQNKIIFILKPLSSRLRSVFFFFETLSQILPPWWWCLEKTSGIAIEGVDNCTANQTALGMVNRTPKLGCENRRLAAQPEFIQLRQ